LGYFKLSHRGLHNPLGIARLCAQLEEELLKAGFRVQLSSDFKLFDQTKLALRGVRVGPMHDPDVCDFSNERAFWMRLVDVADQTVGLQAYRCDEIDTSLADWLPNYMIGVYMRRQEMMVPSHAKPPQGSVAERLRGRLVYEGELWLARDVKGKRIFDCFTRLGLLLCCVKWNPEAIWGLAGEQMAKHGHVGRIGYNILERGFLRWLWASKDVDRVEYLAVIERTGIEQLIEEMLLTEAVCQPQLFHTPR
jgi:hypothetical protein